MEFILKPIGFIKVQNGQYSLQLQQEYIAGLKHIEGFSHLQILWWAHLTDEPEARSRNRAKNLFKNAPDEVGVFACRTPERPNPVMLSTIKADSIQAEKGIIKFTFIDAEDGTPVVDIKPYFPVERIRECKTPEWYSHWPRWAEDAHRFDWKNEISFDGL